MPYLALVGRCLPRTTLPHTHTYGSNTLLQWWDCLPCRTSLDTSDIYSYINNGLVRGTQLTSECRNSRNLLPLSLICFRLSIKMIATNASAYYLITVYDNSTKTSEGLV